MKTVKLNKDSLAGLSFSILSDLLLDIIFEIAVSTHKREVFSKRKCLRCNKFCHFYSINSGSDIFGKPYQTPVTAPYYSCTICSREIAAGRYVPHLEKCLGSGRLSNRLAHQKTNGYGTSISSCTNNVENDISSEDETQHRKKRRRPTNGSTKYGSTKSHLKLKKPLITSNNSDVDLQA
ncbi:hypothetical protein PNEG_00486 [Pneumocystis murina B123]|uniref:SAGA-associated factor 11 n=1 Tax=Pneumocystis murina (strain B123) TaxID=1069680 RepID=M7NWE6_PNEMU|nr:hypothetical protein PNEG_00486 [Pneumocystis murina B123]EMR11471.1 hypothetical protein PNEG_00486 [Pneumocystis murina B123]